MKRKNEWTVDEVKGEVTRSGNGAHVTVPRSWIGKKAVVRLVV